MSPAYFYSEIKTQDTRSAPRGWARPLGDCWTPALRLPLECDACSIRREVEGEGLWAHN
jgi:hypothetical protein